MWLRVQGVSERNASKLGRFFWLTPPSFSGALSIANVARESTPASRATLAARYVECVWTTWSRVHGETVSAWFDEFIAPH